MERKVAELELGLFTSGYQRYPLEQAFEDASRFGYNYGAVIRMRMWKI